MYQDTIWFRHQVHTSQKRPARLFLYPLQSAGPNHGLKLVLQRLQVSWRVIVKNHQVKIQTLVMKVLMTTNEFPYNRQIFRAVDSHYDYWQIATDPVGPETGLGLGIESQNMRPRPQGWFGVDYPFCEPLKEMRILGVDTQMAHLDLSFGPGQSRFAFEDARVVILVRQHHRLLSRVGDRGAKSDAGSLVRLDAYPATQAEDGIEHGPHSIG